MRVFIRGLSVFKLSTYKVFSLILLLILSLSCRKRRHNSQSVARSHNSLTGSESTNGLGLVDSTIPRTWINKTTQDGIGDNSVLGVSASGTNVYAASNRGLSISTNSGNTWVNNSMGGGPVTGVYASGTTVYAATMHGVMVSTDSGSTWTTKAGNGLGGGNAVFGVYAAGSTIYAATANGLSISTNGGNTWTNKTTANGLGHYFINKVFATPTTIYAATADGLSISNDNIGNTWSNKRGNGLGDNYINGVFVSGGKIYAATQRGLSISTDLNGNTWTNRVFGGDARVFDVFVSGSKIFAATMVGLCISTDGGASWQTMTTANGLGSNVVTGVYVTDTKIYVATGSGFPTDGGLSIGNISTARKFANIIRIYGDGQSISWWNSMLDIRDDTTTSTFEIEDNPVSRTLSLYHITNYSSSITRQNISQFLISSVNYPVDTSPTSGRVDLLMTLISRVMTISPADELIFTYQGHGAGQGVIFNYIYPKFDIQTTFLRDANGNYIYETDANGNIRYTTMGHQPMLKSSVTYTVAANDPVTDFLRKVNTLLGGKKILLFDHSTNCLEASSINFMLRAPYTKYFMGSSLTMGGITPNLTDFNAENISTTNSTVPSRQVGHRDVNFYLGLSQTNYLNKMKAKMDSFRNYWTAYSTSQQQQQVVQVDSLFDLQKWDAFYALIRAKGEPVQNLGQQAMYHTYDVEEYICKSFYQRAAPCSGVEMDAYNQFKIKTVDDNGLGFTWTQRVSGAVLRTPMGAETNITRIP